MSLRESLLGQPSLSELNILEKAISVAINQRRDEIIQYYIDNDLEVAFMVETRVGKRKVKITARAKPKYIGKEYISGIGTHPESLNGKKTRIPKVWVTDVASEVNEAGPEDDNLPDVNPDTQAAMDGVDWNG